MNVIEQPATHQLDAWQAEELVAIRADKFGGAVAVLMNDEIAQRVVDGAIMLCAQARRAFTAHLEGDEAVRHECRIEMAGTTSKGARPMEKPVDSKPMSSAKVRLIAARTASAPAASTSLEFCESAPSKGARTSQMRAASHGPPAAAMVVAAPMKLTTQIVCERSRLPLRDSKTTVAIGIDAPDENKRVPDSGHAIDRQEQRREAQDRQRACQAAEHEGLMAHPLGLMRQDREVNQRGDLLLETADEIQPLNSSFRAITARSLACFHAEVRSS